MVVKRRTPRARALTQGLLVAVVIILLHLIANEVSFRLDFTQDGRYTLSQSTKDLLEEIPEVVTLNAYFSEDLPPNLLVVQQDFKDLLVEYENAADGQFVYAFENPSSSLENEQKAQKAGISPVLLNVRERDQVKQRRIYMGATLHAGNKKENIPFLKTDRSAEHALTTAIKKLTLRNKQKVGLIQGHGEPTPDQVKELQTHLSVLYDVAPLSLSDETEVHTDYKAWLWIAPTEDVPQDDLKKAAEYINQGGRIFLAYSGLDLNLNTQPFGIKSKEDLGVSNWLQTMGIYLNTNDVLIDAQCSAITVAQQMGGFVFNSQVQFPYFPNVQTFAEHPITNGLEAAYLQFTSPILHRVEDTTKQGRAITLLKSSSRAGLRPLPDYINVNQKWEKSDFLVGEQNLALALTGDALPHPDARLVVLSAHNFLVPQQEGQAPPEANVLFAVNAIDWLADDTGLIELRNKGISSRPLASLEDNQKAWISYANVFVPILFILLYAVGRSQYQRRQRKKWLS